MHTSNLLVVKRTQDLLKQLQCSYRWMKNVYTYLKITFQSTNTNDNHGNCLWSSVIVC